MTEFPNNDLKHFGLYFLLVIILEIGSAKEGLEMKARVSLQLCQPPLITFCTLVYYFRVSDWLVKLQKNILVTQAHTWSESERIENRSMACSYEALSFNHGGKIFLRHPQEICLTSYWPELSHIPTPS